MKITAKHLEWTSYVPQLSLPCILNPSEVVSNFPPYWVPTGIINSPRMKSRHEMKLNAKHPKRTSYAPKLILACIFNPPQSVLNFPRQRIQSCNIKCMRTKSRHEIKLSDKHHEWTQYVPLFVWAFILNLSESMLNVSSPRRAKKGTIMSTRTKSSLEMKQSVKHPE